MLAVNQGLSRRIRQHPNITRNVTFFKSIFQKEDSPYDKMIAKCNRPKQEKSTSYKSNLFARGKKGYSHIDIIATEDLREEDIAIALLVNAAKNNLINKSLDNIVLSMRALGSFRTGRYLFNFQDIPFTIFKNIINKLQNKECLNFQEIMAYNEALPAYRITHFFSQGSGSSWIPTPNGYMCPIEEQFIAGEYNLLHFAPGLKNADMCVADILAKQEIYSRLRSGYEFRLTGNQCLMSLDEYEQNLKDNHPTAAYMLLS